MDNELNLNEIQQQLTTSNPQPYKFSKTLSAQNNLLATLLAMGAPEDEAFKQAIHKYNPAYHSKPKETIIKDLHTYLQQNPKVLDAYHEYKNNFITHYTHSLQINKDKILYQISKLHELAIEKEELKTALDCLKTIGQELGMFQKNIQVQHSYTPSSTIVELIDNNLANTTEASLID